MGDHGVHPLVHRFELPKEDLLVLRWDLWVKDRPSAAPDVREVAGVSFESFFSDVQIGSLQALQSDHLMVLDQVVEETR